jgi:hypothetical protein
LTFIIVDRMMDVGMRISFVALTLWVTARTK